MANNRIGIKCNVCGKIIWFAKSYADGFYVPSSFSIESLNEFFDKHCFCCEGVENGIDNGETEGDFSLEYEFPYTTEMIDDGNNIKCSECGTLFKDEILYCFNSATDFKFCPCCGMKISKTK